MKVELSYMNPIRYVIASEIFARFPSYLRGCVVATTLKNGTSPEELTLLLRSAEETVRKRLTLEQVTSEPCLNSWREAFRVVGMKPADYRPSVEGLVRRVLHGQELPSINTLVDIGNIISLRYLLPVGGHAIDELNEDMNLRMASGEEEFIPFGSDQTEHPEKGEIILAAGNTVLTRRWIWRQANFTLTLPETKAMVFNLDAMPPIGEAELENIANEMMALIQQYCGGKLVYSVLKKDQPAIPLK
jgi:DNA/RNA-binding domain of Phe-tRNA-synthetase-like protein